MENLKKTKKAGRGGGVAKEAQATERERGREKDNARASGEPTRVYTIHASGGPGEIIFYDYGRSGAAKAGHGRRLEEAHERLSRENENAHEGASYILYIQWPWGS